MKVFVGRFGENVNMSQMAPSPCPLAANLVNEVKDVPEFLWHEACLPCQARRRQVTKVAHYWLEVNAVTRPMMVREDGAPYGGEES